MEKRLNENSEEEPQVPQAQSPRHESDDIPPALLVPEESRTFRSRWENIQIRFLDEPRQSVQRADELVADTIKRLTEMFARERDRLEHEWARGDPVSTEELRVALRCYCAFFDRLLKNVRQDGRSYRATSVLRWSQCKNRAATVRERTAPTYALRRTRDGL